LRQQGSSSQEPLAVAEWEPEFLEVALGEVLNDIQAYAVLFENGIGSKAVRIQPGVERHEPSP
jgi:hypothetical protein